MKRRTFIKSASGVAALALAPAIVRSEWIMPVKPVRASLSYYIFKLSGYRYMGTEKGMERYSLNFDGVPMNGFNHGYDCSCELSVPVGVNLPSHVEIGRQMGFASKTPMVLDESVDMTLSSFTPSEYGPLQWTKRAVA